MVGAARPRRDGYLFNQTEVYNPWSVLKYVKKGMEESPVPESFWANTSGNEIIYRYIQQGTAQMKVEFDELMKGNAIEKNIKSELTYREMDDIDNIYSFLLFTGYLKIEKSSDLYRYYLKIPNKEIEMIPVSQTASILFFYLFLLSFVI